MMMMMMLLLVVLISVVIMLCYFSIIGRYKCDINTDCEHNLERAKNLKYTHSDVLVIC